MKILHLADLHLGIEVYGLPTGKKGLSSRLEDFSRALSFAVELAIAEKCELLIFAGDAFKNREPNPTVQNILAAALIRLTNQGIVCFLLPGNHDLPTVSGRAHTLELYATLKLPGIIVASKNGIYPVTTPSGTVQLVAQPWLIPSQVLSAAELSLTLTEQQRLIGLKVTAQLNNLSGQLNPDLAHLLVTHTTVEGALPGSERELTISSDFTLPNSIISDPCWHYVALGHLHRYQVISKQPLAVYPGSLERIDFGEQFDQKGVVIVDLDLQSRPFKVQHHFHPYAARPFITLNLTLQDSQSPLVDIKQQLQGQSLQEAIVRVVISTKGPSPLIPLRELSQLLHKEYQIHNLASVTVIATNSHPAKLLTITERSTPLAALTEYLRPRELAPNLYTDVLVAAEVIDNKLKN